MQENYKILGISESATQQEIDEAYQSLKKRLREDMFSEGEKGAEAASLLTKVESAYREICEEKNRTDVNSQSGNNYAAVENLVKANKINEAQHLLDDMMTRDSEWHYYQAMIYYRKDWFTDCKKQLEIAIDGDATNEKYRSALARLEKVMDGESKKTEKVERPHGFNPYDNNFTGESKNTSYSSNEDRRAYVPDDDQMGGCDSSLDCCTQLLCLNCLCNMCGGCR